MDPFKKLRAFLERLQSPFVGREEEARVVTLTLLSREHAVLVGEPGCVTGDTIISDGEGRLYYFDELAGNYGLGAHNFYFKVYPEGMSTELHIYDVDKVMEIVTERGFKIKVTPNHPLMTDTGWVRADCLAPGDLIRIFTYIPSPPSRPCLKMNEAITNNKSPEIPKVVNSYLSELMGLYLRFGCINDYALVFTLPEKLKEHIGRIKLLMAASFGEGINDYLEFRVKRTNSKLRVYELRYPNSVLANLFRLIDSRVALGRLPEFILKLPHKELLAFMRGVFSGAKLSSGGLNVKLNSAGVAEGIHVLLLKLGVIALRRNDEIIVDRYEDLIKLATLRVLPEHISAASYGLLKHSFEDYIISRGFDRIAKISVIKGRSRVYDLHIPSTHSFLTNGVLSHNTAKSALVRRAAELLNARFFKYLLTRFTEPAELFGPLDIKSLEEGKYVRLTQGKLPEADIAFLDEIFKANSAILNALNSLLQERVLYDGFTEMQVPLWSLFGASNEVPEDPEIEALYDRFCVRHFVKPVPEDYWMELLDKSWRIERAMYYEGGFNGGGIMSIGDLRELHERVLNVDLSPVKGKLVKLFAIFESRGIRVTDRRKGKVLKLIAANAVLEGRSIAEEHDLIVLKYVIPRDWDELDKVNLILSEELKTPYKYLKELEEIRNNIREIMNYVISLENVSSRYIESRFRLMLKDLEVTRERVMSMARECSDERVRKVINDILMLIDDAERAINRRIR